MVQESGVVEFFGVKRYHPIHGAKKFIVHSYDQLPDESEGWYDSPGKAAQHKEQDELLVEMGKADEVMDKPYMDKILPMEIKKGVERLLSGETVNGKKGLSNISFTTLYGYTNNTDKKKLKPLFQKVIEGYGDLIEKERTVYFWRK
jgi:hypothetical protein